jgi:hypothetical protein
LQEATVREKWALIVPPILTVLDDQATDVKTKGCELLALQLHITPPDFLARTGLAPVFEDALMPGLTYLPSLTPPAASARLLAQAYPALLALSKVAYAPAAAATTATAALSTARSRARAGVGGGGSSAPSGSGGIGGNGSVFGAPTPTMNSGRLRFLDRVLRDGVLAGYAHSHDATRVATLLVRQMGVIVDAMGVWSVKYLKYTVPLLSDILASAAAAADITIAHNDDDRDDDLNDDLDDDDNDDGNAFGASSARPGKVASSSSRSPNTLWRHLLPLLLAAAATQQVVLRNAWPRVPRYRAEVLRGLALCWCALHRHGNMAPASRKQQQRQQTSNRGAKKGKEPERKQEQGQGQEQEQEQEPEPEPEPEPESEQEGKEKEEGEGEEEEKEEAKEGKGGLPTLKTMLRQNFALLRAIVTHLSAAAPAEGAQARQERAQAETPHEAAAEQEQEGKAVEAGEEEEEEEEELAVDFGAEIELLIQSNSCVRGLFSSSSF